MVLSVRRLSSVTFALLWRVNIRTRLGWNLRRLRVAKGLSQESLAFASQIDRSYVGRVERGSENVTVATLEALARVLDVDVRDLFDPVDPIAKAPAGLSAGRKGRR